MKIAKQILAIIGVVLLVALYVTTLIFAITDNTGTMSMFVASVVATVVIPVLIWAYTFIFQLIKKHYGPDSDSEEDNSSDGNS